MLEEGTVDVKTATFPRPSYSTELGFKQFILFEVALNHCLIYLLALLQVSYTSKTMLLKTLL